MKATDILKKVAEIVGVELSSMGSKSYAKLKDGGVISANAFENGNVVLTGDGPGSLSDGDYEVIVDGENGAQLYKLVIEKGVIAQFELLPNKAKQKMSTEEIKSEEVEETVNLAEEVKEEEPKKDEEVKEEKMSIEDVVAALEARLKALEDKLAGAEVEVEMPEMKKEEKMSASKKFNGAPVEEKKVNPIVTNSNKTRSTIDSVWEKMSNFK
jgi:hypothetical protein